MQFLRLARALSTRGRVIFTANKVNNNVIRISYPSFRALSTQSQLSTDIIKDRIFTVLKGYEKIPADAVTAEAHFTKDLKLDSLDTVEVVMAIEEEFSIEIPDHDADEIKSVQDAINYVSSRKDAV